MDVVKLAQRYGFMVIRDFAYGDVCFDGYQAPSFLSVPGAKEVGVEYTTMSKGYNMAGWRLGFCAGNAEMVRALATIKGYYDYGIFQADPDRRHHRHARTATSRWTSRSPSTSAAATCWWTACDASAGRSSAPKASMFVWARYPEQWRRQMDSIDFAMKLIEEAEVAVSPGRGFGDAGRRLSAAGPGRERTPPTPGGPPDRPLSAPGNGHRLTALL